MFSDEEIRAAYLVEYRQRVRGAQSQPIPAHRTLDQYDERAEWDRAPIARHRKGARTMGIVGGSRHYDGGGLGTVAGWTCPACGAENGGPLEQGCVRCGSGKPGHRVEAKASAEQTIFQRWVQTHPNASLEDAFTAGYVEGVRASRKPIKRAVERPLVVTPEAKQRRTLIAALTLFRDQVLAEEPEEIESGEWLSGAEVDALLTALQHQEEA